MKYIYVCGPTTYEKAHIGNLRPIITFDIFLRAFKIKDNDIKLIHNITDIDDKIITKAKEKNVSEKEISKKYSDLYFKYLKSLNVNTITSSPTVTDNINIIISFIEQLLKNGSAYEVDGNVYFDISKSNNYGSLSGKKISELQFENNSNKKHPADFALWKNTTEGITFDSPWSKGRPGWHTECAAFINKETNGESLEYHSGGIDLIFPHHENENVQYQALLNKPITKKWIHVGQVNLNKEKMSKSENNVLSFEKFDKKYGADFLRLIYLQSNVTSPLNIDDETLSNLLNNLNKFKKAYKLSRIKGKNIDLKGLVESITSWNWSETNKLINNYIKEFNKDPNETNSSKVYSALKMIGFNFSLVELSSEDKSLLIEWEELKQNKEYEKADNIRETLKNKELI